MKILAIGDFHGKFQNKWNKLIKKERVDLVVSNGDFFPFHYRKLWFKHCYGKEIQLWEAIGKKKVKELVNEDLKMGEEAIRKLNGVKVPVITVFGNLDYTRNVDVADFNVYKGNSNKWDWYEQDFFSPIIKKYKNIKRFDYKAFKFGDYVFIGAYGGTFPGKVKSKNYKKHRQKLEKLFRKYRNENKERKVIFVSHNVPYDTKLDKIGMKAHKRVRGKHYGSKLIRRIIHKYQPVLHIGGHVHEGMGKQKIGKTLAVNTGSAQDGEAAIIDLDKMKVKFIK